MIGQRELSMEDYKAIARRRIWYLVIPAVVLCIAAYTISLFLPSRYTSETLVLVEEQRVPEDLVKPIVGGDLGQRLATMQEQILSRTRLQHIIETFGLYKDESGKASMEDLVAKLRKSITITPVRAMSGTNSNGLPGFTVSVVANQAQLAQQICTEVTSIFMQQNVLFRERRAEDTTEFLTKQLEEAKGKLDEQDAKLADFQRKNLGTLPDEMQTNFSFLTALASQLEGVNQALNRAQQDKIYVESTLNQQLAIAKPMEAGSAAPDVMAAQLSSLQAQLVTLQGRYTDEHPDVVKVRNDIAKLQKKMQEQADAPRTAGRGERTSGVVETAQIQQLRSQLHQLDVTIHERAAEQSRIQQQISSTQNKLQQSPAVAQEYKSLTRDYQTALSIYNDLLKKQNDSKISTDLEHRQQGEQFRVLDPPSLPLKPTFPNRMVFGFGGLFGGLALGAAIAFVLEAQDSTFRSERDVEMLLKLPTLVLIPAVQVEKGSRVNLVRKLTAKDADSTTMGLGA